MKKKYVITLAIVGCLIAVLSLSYAYFTSSINQNGDGKGSVTVNTVEIGGTSFQVEGLLEFKDLDIYPGHKNVSSIKVTATGKNTIAAYNLIWNGINTLNTSLKYYVYESEEELNPSITCSKKEEGNSVSKIYYEECTNSNFDGLGSIISEGEITSRATDEETIILPKQVIKGTEEGTVRYYYVVLEYPNLSESQNIDMGGTFKGEVTIKKADIKADTSIMAVYLEQDDGTYKESSEIPQEGYRLNEEKSVCNNGAVPTWDWNKKGLLTTNLTQSGTECYLYFDKGQTAQSIIAGLTKSIRTDFSTVLTTNTTGTIYSAVDDDGTSYYYAGVVDNNWVRFGGFYWRIIRINGDGSIRLIYNGTETKQTGEGTQVGTSAFNPNNGSNPYLGYMYTSGQVHGLGTESTIKQTLDSWYTSNLASYASKIDSNAGFCNDREPSTDSTTSNGSGGTGATTTYYGGYIRLVNGKNSSFKCTNSSDLFTKSGATKGNKALTNPIGLITADEVAYAGGMYGSNNTSYYLYTGQNYWTMSPFYFDSTTRTPYIFHETSYGRLDSTTANSSWGVRPVINLKADTLFNVGGTGTISTPYVVK